VVTLRGDRPTGRVGASLLTAAGLEDLVADNPESYLRKAADLGKDVRRLAELRFGLRDRMRASPLCDEAGFARSMEQAYRSMWHAWCAAGDHRVV
jgi:protein O-GlcNAc transferase